MLAHDLAESLVVLRKVGVGYELLQLLMTGNYLLHSINHGGTCLLS